MSMLGVTFMAVSKVIVCVLIGAVTSSSIPNSKSTLRDFSFLISAVLLTSLTLSNIAQSVTLELLARCSIAILFSVLLIVCGFLGGMACSAILFRRSSSKSGVPDGLRNDVRLDLLFDEEEGSEESPAESARVSPTSLSQPSRKSKKRKTRVPYVAVVLSEHLREVGVDGSDIVPSLDIPDKSLEDMAGYIWAMCVGCSTQNGVTLPLSLMANIASSVDFINFAQSAAYIFIFSISYMLYLWVAGPLLVEQGEKAAAKQRLIRELVAKHKRMTGRCDVTTQTLSFPVDHVLQYDAEVRNSPAGASAREGGDPCVGTQRSPRSDSSTGTATAPGKESDDSSGNSEMYTCRVSVTSFSAGAQTESPVMNTRGPSTAVAISVPDSQPVMSPNTASRYAFTMATADQIPYDWQRAGIIRVKYQRDMKAMKKTTLSEKMSRYGHAAWGLVRRLMVNPPFLSVVVGIAVGVITPVHGLFFDGGALEMVMDAITVIGEGSIPSSLLLLGANLIVSATGDGAVAEEEGRMRHAEQNTEYPLRGEDWELLGEDRHYATWYGNEHAPSGYDLHNSFSLQTLRQLGEGPTAYVAQSSGSSAAALISPMEEEEGEDRKHRNAFLAGIERALSLRGVSKSFVCGVIVLRLLVFPALSFMLLIFLIKAMPPLFGKGDAYDKTLIMVLMVELSSPTAINSTLIFNARQFMTFPWAKMLFLQYVLCIVTMVMWSSLGLTYVSRLE